MFVPGAPFAERTAQGGRPILNTLARKVFRSTGVRSGVLWPCVIGGFDGALAAFDGGVALAAVDDSPCVSAPLSRVTATRCGRVLEIDLRNDDPMSAPVRVDFAEPGLAAHIASELPCSGDASHLDEVATGDSFVYSNQYLGGTFPPIGFPVDLLFRRNRVEVLPAGGLLTRPLLSTIAFSSSLEIHISGPGEVTTDAGFVGGGFGLKGAAQGIAAAYVLNALTSRTTITTFIQMLDLQTEIVLVNRLETPTAIRLRLAGVFAELRQLAAVAPAQATIGQGIGSALQDLVQLNRDGILTDEEFVAAKAAILEGLGRGLGTPGARNSNPDVDRPVNHDGPVT